MKISQKQQELNDAVRSGKYNEIMLAGGAGSAKTIGILNVIDELCTLVSGCRIGVFRLSDRNVEENTIPSYKKMLGFKDKNIPIINKVARYPNGSEILFRWADISKDKDCDNIKGGEFTWIFFNEANQIDQKYVNIGKTRVGRWNKFQDKDGKEFRIKPVVFMDCNPTNNWVKTDYYDKANAGTLPANVFFQLSLPSDNPFLEPEYWEMLNSLPPAEYNRFVMGNWDYNDDPNQLIKFEWIKNSEYIPTENSKVDAMGGDIAREGNDRTVFALGGSNAVWKWETFRHQDTMTTAQLFVERMKEYRLNADRCAVDVIGVGGGVVDYIVKSGYNIIGFNSGDSVREQVSFLSFKNKRAKAYWDLRTGLQEGTMSLGINEDLRKELLNIRYTVTDKVIQIESKAEIKRRLGFSPDLADATVMCFSAMQGKKEMPILSFDFPI